MARLTYASSGVDREARARAKAGLRGLRGTYPLSRHGRVLETPFNTLYPVGGGMYQVKCADGVGTKVMLAQLAGKHDTIGIDAVAMVANDVIRCGATPLAITDMIDIRKSERRLIAEIERGLRAGAEMAGCPIVGGETADLPELMAAPYHINADCVGEVARKSIIDGRAIRPGDAVIGIRSSGLHSNGITLARRALFKEWGGKYDAWARIGGLERELVLAALEPTRIYVRQFLRLARKVRVLGAVHITGDAYLKFAKLTQFGFEFDRFEPQPIFELIQEAGVPWPEMFRTFNMGWGFAAIVRRSDADDALDALGKDADVIGKVVRRGITVKFGGKRMVLK